MKLHPKPTGKVLFSAYAGAKCQSSAVSIYEFSEVYWHSNNLCNFEEFLMYWVTTKLEVIINRGKAKVFVINNH